MKANMLMLAEDQRRSQDVYCKETVKKNCASWTAIFDLAKLIAESSFYKNANVFIYF